MRAALPVHSIFTGQAHATHWHPCRWVLAQAGPLPQYHPAVLAALTLAGKQGAVTAILSSLLTWLLALRQHATTAQQGEGGSLLDGSREGDAAAGLRPSSLPAQPPLQGLEASGMAPTQAPSYIGELLEPPYFGDH